MRRCLLILPLLLLTAPAVAHAGGFATTGLSSTPEGLRAGQPWKVELTILQHGRTPLGAPRPPGPGRASLPPPPHGPTPLSGLHPRVDAVDADGNRTTFRATP